MPADARDEDAPAERDVERAALLERLRDSVAAGEYEVESLDVADSILRFFAREIPS